MTDGELVGLVLSGRTEVYSEVVARHQGRIYRLCCHVCGNATDAGDLAHDSFVEGYLKLEQLRDPESYGAWLRAIALNLCRSWYRERRRLLPLEACSLADAPEIPDDRRRRVRTGVAQLSPDHRVALALHYWDGLSCEEIAAFLDVPVGTVMSRLHRARQRLKALLSGADGEETTVVPDDDFRRDVEAEIRILLAMFREDAGAIERLSLILRSSPERLARLIASADDNRAVEDLARLLPRLGAGALATALSCRFSTDAALRCKADAVLTRLVSLGAPGLDGAHRGRIAPRWVYALVGRVLAFDTDADSKARLLLDLLLAAGKNDAAALLLANALLCDPDAAMPHLLERFWRAAKPGDVHRHGDVLWALCRTGTRFGSALIEALHETDGARALVALAGAEALARTLHHEPGRLGRDGWFDLASVSDEEVAQDARLRRKWAVPLRADRDECILGRLAEAAATFTSHEDAGSRATAATVLGRLRARAHAGRVAGLVGDAAGPVRLAALRALANLADPCTLGAAAACVTSADATERAAAAEALGAVQAAEGLPIIATLLEDPDGGVRRAAVSALRWYPPEQTLAVLEKVGKDRTAQTAAARAMHEARAARVRRPGDDGDFHMADVVRQGARTARFVSLEMALRALPHPGPYGETEITRIIAGASWDYSSVRRYLVEEGLLDRAGGVYQLSEAGVTAWRVERHIAERYMQ